MSYIICFFKLIYYRSINGLPQYKHEILYYPPVNNNALPIPYYLQQVNETTLRLNRFSVPEAAGEAFDYEGMSWNCKEDYDLLIVSFYLIFFIL